MRFRRLCVCLPIVLLFASGCTGADDDDDGDSTRDTGTCLHDAGDATVATACAPLPDSGAGDADGGVGPGSGFKILGTCFDHDPETPICEESWASETVTNAEGIEKLRDEGETNCLDGEPENEWTRADDVCPKDEGYLGTCKFETGPTYSEHSWYEPAEVGDANEGCEMLGGNWVVE